MKRHRAAIIIGCTVFVVAIVGAAVFFNSNKKKEVPTEVSMQTAVLEKRTVMNTLSITGTVESAASKTVTSSMTDVEVETVNAQVGDHVKKGDIICIFDSSDLKEDLADAQTNLNVSQAKTANELKAAEEALENAKASTEISKARATENANEASSSYLEAKEKSEKAYEEYENAEEKASNLNKKVSEYKDNLQEAKTELKNLKNTLEQTQDEEEKSAVQKEIESKNAEITSINQTYEKAQTDYEAAKKTAEEKLAAYETARKEADSAGSTYKKATQEQEDAVRNGEESISNKEDSLDNSRLNAVNASAGEEEQVENLKEQVEGCTIVAPSDGIITALHVEAGETFSGGDVVTVQDDANFIVTAVVDEYDIADVEKGMRVVVKTDATGEEELEGEITFVSPVPSANSEAAGSSQSESGYPIEISLNTENERLRIGMTAKASIVLKESKDVFAVPYDAISTNESGESIIYVMDDDSAKAGKMEERNTGTDRMKPDGTVSGNGPARGEKSGFGTSTQRAIVVAVGLESDYYTEISSDELVEGMKVVLSTPNISENTKQEKSSADTAGLFGNMSGGKGNGSRGQAPGGF